MMILSQQKSTADAVFVFLLGVAACLAQPLNTTDTTTTNTTTTSGTLCPSLSWSDEFDGTFLDTSQWTPQSGDGCQFGQNLCGWGNNEPQWYQAQNAAMSSGTLKMTAIRESVQNMAFTSARMDTEGKVEVDLTKDTLVEARIKVPSGGMGIWPAFWMMPSDDIIWPLGGEIDIMEFIGREPYFAQGYFHYGTVFGDKSQQGGPIRLPEPLYEDFHVFSMVKTENKIAYLLDGYEYQSYTIDDIEPKYTWPFERTYFLILNVAAGGSWPGYPDESTIFPTTMEVDYVRVYDLEGGGTFPLIDGTRLVHQNDAQVEYCVSDNVEGSSITWQVPADASFVASSTPDCILVDFGAASGYVKAALETTCTLEGSYNLAVPVEVQPFYGVDFSILDPAAASSNGTTLDFGTGESTLVVEDGTPALKYTRSLDLFDHFYIDVADISSSDLPQYLSGDRKFFLDIKTTTSAPCTQILIQLEDTAVAFPENFPVGRHSRYQCLLEPTREWQRVGCDFMDQPDPSTTVVDLVHIFPDLTLTRDDVYYFGKIDAAVSGCTANCEELQTNGASTDNCRRASKSEAGACNDGINNNYEGYNGNLVTECDDPACFMIDPACGGLPTAPPATSSPTVAVPSSSTTSRPNQNMSLTASPVQIISSSPVSSPLPDNATSTPTESADDPSSTSAASLSDSASSASSTKKRISAAGNKSSLLLIALIFSAAVTL